MKPTKRPKAKSVVKEKTFNVSVKVTVFRTGRVVDWYVDKESLENAILRRLEKEDF